MVLKEDRGRAAKNVANDGYRRGVPAAPDPSTTLQLFQ